VRCIAALLGAAAVAAAGGCGGEGSRELAEAQQPRSIASGWPQERVRIALVLSSGGLRGLAHLGVLRVLDAHGLKPDLIVGSSVGAIVGASYAAGLRPDEVLDRPLPALLDPWGSWLVSAGQRSRLLEAFVAEVVAGRSIEELPRRFVAVATERNTGCLVFFGGGDVARAVTASSALPGALAPVVIGDKTFADGGLGAPLPVRVARALGAERVIAVDTTFHAQPEVPGGLIDSVFHAGMVMSRHLAWPDRAAADVLIEPQLPPVPEITMANSAQLVAAGERAALAQLNRLRQLFAAPEPAKPRALGLGVAALPACDPILGRWAVTTQPANAAERPAVLLGPHAL
jgi:NTE family protein